MTEVKGRLTSLEGRVDGMEGRFGVAEGRVGVVERHLQALRAAFHAEFPSASSPPSTSHTPGAALVREMRKTIEKMRKSAEERNWSMESTTTGINLNFGAKVRVCEERSDELRRIFIHL